MAATGKVKAGRAIMSFLIPPVGIITYFMVKNEDPKRAKAYLGISLAALALQVGSAVMYKMNKDKTPAGPRPSTTN